MSVTPSQQKDTEMILCAPCLFVFLFISEQQNHTPHAAVKGNECSDPERENTLSSVENQTFGPRVPLMFVMVKDASFFCNFPAVSKSYIGVFSPKTKKKKTVASFVLTEEHRRKTASTVSTGKHTGW